MFLFDLISSSRKNKKSRLRLVPRQYQKLTFRNSIFSAITAIVAGTLIIIFNVTGKKEAHGSEGTVTIPVGSFIINMGVTPQTINNGLYPYGLLYDMIINHNVPVKWVVEPTKVKDGTDFTYNAVNYKGGTFIITSDYINSTITSRITYWQGQGVQGVYTTSTVNVPVYKTITVFPNVTIDNLSSKQSIIMQYFTDASIPSSAYSIGAPSVLNNCNDVWVNPHGDPTWATHGSLYNFLTVAKSFIWCECHSVSVMESCKNTSSPFEQLNFLTTNGLQCYSSNKCVPTVSQTHAGGSTAPYTYNYIADPLMQFMGTIDAAISGGSETWYIPQTTSSGQWRPTTQRLVTTADGTSPAEGVLAAYGPAFGDPTNGWVMYEAGHDESGSGASSVAAERMFFNYILFAGVNKQITINSYTIPTDLYSIHNYSLAISLSGGSSPYSYAWSSNVGGSFSNVALANPVYTAPVISTPSSGVLTCTVTDVCGRKNFISQPVALRTGFPLPVQLMSFDAKLKNDVVNLIWETGTEINNDYFTIERSTDAENFTPIKKIDGAGNSTAKLYYSATDEKPLTGTSYYRLKQTDYDGKFAYSAIVAVHDFGNKLNAEHLEIENYGPNPVYDSFHIDFGVSSDSQVEIQLLSAGGKVVYNESIKAEKGFNSHSFTNIKDIPVGIYFIRLSCNDQTLIRKLIKE